MSDIKPVSNKDFFKQCMLFKGSKEDKQLGFIAWGLIVLFLHFVILLYIVSNF